MYQIIRSIPAITCFLFALSVPAYAQNPANAISSAGIQGGGNVKAGRTIFQANCSDCHSIQPDADRFGPTLAGVYGREVGTAPLHRYSTAMKAAHFIWNEQALDGFLTNPRHYLKGTIMPYSGMASATQRQDVIAYLETLHGH